MAEAVLSRGFLSREETMAHRDRLTLIRRVLAWHRHQTAMPRTIIALATTLQSWQQQTTGIIVQIIAITLILGKTITR